MCKEKRYVLACGHMGTKHEHCKRRAAGAEAAACGSFTRETVDWPPARSSDLPACPLVPNCPYTARGGVWNCCECGFVMNRRARCASQMIHGRMMMLCEHLCCDNCPEGSYRL